MSQSMNIRQYSWNKLCVITMISCKLEDLRERQFDMINIITHCDSTNFFSFIYNNDELTLYYDKQQDHYVSSMVSYIYKHDYICYKISNLGDLMEESGSINQITSYFSKEKIPILYLTSFNNDNIMIPIEYEAQVNRLIGIE